MENQEYNRIKGVGDEVIPYEWYLTAKKEK